VAYGGDPQFGLLADIAVPGRVLPLPDRAGRGGIGGRDETGRVAVAVLVVGVIGAQLDRREHGHTGAHLVHRRIQDCGAARWRTAQPD
jgi:hypothetical protein